MTHSFDRPVNKSDIISFSNLICSISYRCRFSYGFYKILIKIEGDQSSSKKISKKYFYMFQLEDSLF